MENALSSLDLLEVFRVCGVLKALSVDVWPRFHSGEAHLRGDELYKVYHYNFCSVQGRKQSNLTKIGLHNAEFSLVARPLRRPHFGEICLP